MRLSPKQRVVLGEIVFARGLYVPERSDLSTVRSLEKRGLIENAPEPDPRFVHFPTPVQATEAGRREMSYRGPR